MPEIKRRRFTGEQKTKIIKQHLLEKKPISDLCDEYQISPTLFYRWQKQIFSFMPSAFEKSSDKELSKWMKLASELENKLIKKNEVIAEFMEEYLAMKEQII